MCTCQKPSPTSISRQMPIRLNIGTVVDIKGKKYSVVDVEISGIISSERGILLFLQKMRHLLSYFILC